MLELRPNCEWCDKDLPPDAADARICSYECTYCACCAEQVLQDVCATCGGNLVPRPIRSRLSYRDGENLGLAHHRPATHRVSSRWTAAEVDNLTNRLKNSAPRER